MDPAVQLQLIEFAREITPTLIAVLATLGGVGLAHRFAVKQAKVAKSLDFLERRLREFYSPMVGCVKRVRALSDLRFEFGQAANAAWRQLCEQGRVTPENHNQMYAPFGAIIEYDNEQMYAEILPAYDTMIKVFTDNYWLADDEVRSHYASLCRFVEIWHRYKDRSIPYEVLRELDHSEEVLGELYKLLEERLRELTSLLSNRSAA